MENLKEVIKETCSAFMIELKKSGFMKDTRFSPYQKTEQLLYNYINLKQVIVEKESHIEFIKEVGIQKRSKSITSFTGNHSLDTRTDADKADEQIEAIEHSIIITRRYIECIDKALERISGDNYFDLIRLRYFESKTREEIAEHFNVDVATISRNKNRLINSMKIYLFSDEVIVEMFR